MPHDAGPNIGACCPLQTPVASWLEAFAAHPLIGDIETLKRKYGAFAEMSKGEQGAAAATASEEALQVTNSMQA